MPLAISFFTFQQIAYLVDVYRGEAKDYSFLHYSLFITFFPQLIAGPIVHHKEIMPQFDAGDQRSLRLENINIGLTFIAIGLFKKVVIADSLATVADPVFLAAENGQPLSFAEAWIATIGFSLQLYFDFSGYCDIAIGSARLFGIRLPENFYSPIRPLALLTSGTAGILPYPDFKRLSLHLPWRKPPRWAYSIPKPTHYHAARWTLARC